MQLDDIKQNAIISIPQKTVQDNAISAEVHAAIADGTLTMEGALLLREPLRTKVLMVLNGITTANGGFAVYGQLPVLNPLPRVLIAALNPNGQVKVRVVKDARVHGTMQLERMKVVEDRGNVAWVENELGPNGRAATDLLFQMGWPHKKAEDEFPRVVDVAWLVSEVKKGPGRALFGASELLANILARPDFSSIAGAAFMETVAGMAENPATPSKKAKVSA